MGTLEVGTGCEAGALGHAHRMRVMGNVICGPRKGATKAEWSSARACLNKLLELQTAGVDEAGPGDVAMFDVAVCKHRHDVHFDDARQS